MADQPMDGGPFAGGAMSEQDYSAGTLVNLAGAAVSLALVVGVGVWGYQLLARDVSGVPVVRSAQGDMRVEPKDPGGVFAAHQGLSVNDVAAEGLAAATADRLILAPPPIDLDAEDTPMTPTRLSTPPPLDVQVLTRPQNGDQSGDMNDEQMASIQALADQLAAGASPLSTQSPAKPQVAEPQAAEPQALETSEKPGTETGTETAVEGPAEGPVEIAAVAPVNRVEGGIGTSLRPRSRPEGLGTVPANDTVARAIAGPTSAGQEETDPGLIPSGTRLVQLGAYASQDIAQTEWARLNGKFTDYLDGKSRVIQKATSGGRVFYRLRAMGFADLNDARRFCSALMAEGADCIPVVTR